MAGVVKAAAVLGVSARRVRSLIEAGRLPAIKVDGRWDVDARALGGPRVTSRPMSPGNARAFAALAEGLGAPQIGYEERYRLRRMLGGLRVASDPVGWIVSRLARRADRVVLWGADPDAVVTDPRVTVGGVCDPRARMSVTAYAEGYVSAADADLLQLDHGLISPGRRAGNVVLHVADVRPAPVPLMFLIADLAEYGPGRENARAEDLARRWQTARVPS